MLELYDKVAIDTSRNITRSYSTSFSMSIRMLDKQYRDPIYALYGFVRLADEIVDTFYGQDQDRLLKDFRSETWSAIENGISLNPVLHSFQQIVNRYNIPHDLIDAFFHSMAMDLDQTEYDPAGYNEYIYGSAEVVGLMCLIIFVDGDERRYLELKPFAQKLGAAFQKVNFLRDMQSDFEERGRTYFPGVDLSKFDEESFRRVEEDIESDFKAAYEGIMQLPKGARFGVYMAYTYYRRLFDKIRKTPTHDILRSRIRIPNYQKLMLLFGSYLRHSFML